VTAPSRPQATVGSGFLDAPDEVTVGTDRADGILLEGPGS